MLHIDKGNLKFGIGLAIPVVVFALAWYCFGLRQAVMIKLDTYHAEKNIASITQEVITEKKDAANKAEVAEIEAIKNKYVALRWKIETDALANAEKAKSKFMAEIITARVNGFDGDVANASALDNVRSWISTGQGKDKILDLVPDFTANDTASDASTEQVSEPAVDDTIEKDAASGVSAKVVSFAPEFSNDGEDFFKINEGTAPNILSLGVTLPSFADYPSNGVDWMPGSSFRLHYGVDFRTMPYKNIGIRWFEGRSGVVLNAVSDTYGNHLVIFDKDNGMRYEYAHLESIKVKRGDVLSGGELIATTGDSGPFAKSAHLHFEAFKNGFYLPFDWGYDYNMFKILPDYLSDKEIAVAKEVSLTTKTNLEEVLAVFVQLDQKVRKPESIAKIATWFEESEQNGNTTFGDVITDKKIEGVLGKKKSDIVKDGVKFIDAIHSRKLAMLLKKKGMTTDAFMKLAGCEGNHAREGNPFSPYDAHVEDVSAPFAAKKELIERIFPVILDEVKKSKVADRISKMASSGDVSSCDVAFLELGKMYQESSFSLKNPNSHGLFQNLRVDYNKAFPKDMGKEISDEQLRAQVKDSIAFYDEKLKALPYIKRIAGIDRNSSFLLQYAAWAYHGVIGNDPLKDYYTTNNLVNNNLAIGDSLNRNGKGVKDGVFTIAAKLNLLSK